MRLPLASVALVALGLACTHAPQGETPRAGASATLALPQERHLRNLRQLTFGGENAEAYFSFDGAQLVFQSTRDGRLCDQEYVFSPDGKKLVFASNRNGSRPGETNVFIADWVE